MSCADNDLCAIYIQYGLKVSTILIIKATCTDWLINPRLSMTDNGILTKDCIAKPALLIIFGKTLSTYAVMITELLGYIAWCIFFGLPGITVSSCSAITSAGLSLRYCAILWISSRYHVFHWK